jgi:histidine decarboxylase
VANPFLETYPDIVISISLTQTKTMLSLYLLYSQDTTIMGSRNGQAAIAMWVALQRKGIDGLRADVVQCIDNAKYLKEMLDKENIPAWLNDFSTTVTFERPPEVIVQKWQLACKVGRLEVYADAV